MSTLAFAALSSLSLLAAPPADGIQFDGETYLPQFKSDQPDLRLVEFVRQGETVENWTKLFAVRHFPRMTDPQAAVFGLKRALAEQNPLARSQVLVKEGGSEAMIDFLTWNNSTEGMEFNVHLYLKQDGLPGLVSYQFAYRIRDPDALGADKIRAMKEHWCEALREMDLPKVFGR